jgi:hypothetical protein
MRRLKVHRLSRNRGRNRESALASTSDGGELKVLVINVWEPMVCMLRSVPRLTAQIWGNF